MLKLDDFFHLPELATLMERLLHDEPGLTVAARTRRQRARIEPGDHG